MNKDFVTVIFLRGRQCHKCVPFKEEPALSYDVLLQPISLCPVGLRGVVNLGIFGRTLFYIYVCVCVYSPSVGLQLLVM